MELWDENPISSSTSPLQWLFLVLELLLLSLLKKYPRAAENERPSGEMPNTHECWKQRKSSKSPANTLTAVWPHSCCFCRYFVSLHSTVEDKAERKENSQINLKNLISEGKKMTLKRKEPSKNGKKDRKKSPYMFMYVILSCIPDSDVFWLCNSKHVIKNRRQGFFVSMEMSVPFDIWERGRCNTR